MDRLTADKMAVLAKKVLGERGAEALPGGALLWPAGWKMEALRE